MLRAVVFALALLLMLIGVWPCYYGQHAAWPPLIWGAVLLLATVFERWRYRAGARREGEGWTATGERFIDPESGKLVQVYYQASTGERRYEPADQ